MDQLHLLMYEANTFVNDFIKYIQFPPHPLSFWLFSSKGVVCGVCPDIAFVPLRGNATALLVHCWVTVLGTDALLHCCNALLHCYNALWHCTDVLLHFEPLHFTVEYNETVCLLLLN